MIRVENNTSFNPLCSYHSIGTGVLLITSIALATIGLLALFKITGLSSLNSYWYIFELGALVSFAAGSVCCCRCLCISLEKLPPSVQADPQQENPDTSAQALYQTNLSYPTNHAMHPPIPEPKTAEEFFVLARKCVQVKEKDQKNYPRARLLYQQARKLGHVPSTFYLGKCYLLGKGTPQNQAKAVSLFEEAAEKGDVESIYTLSLLDMKQGKMDEGIARLQKIPNKDGPFTALIDTFLAKPRTDNTIAILKKTIESAASHIKAKKKMERSITWRYV